LEKSKKEAKSKWVASQLVEEREIEVLNMERSMQCNEDIIIKRKKKRDRLEEMKSRVDGVVGSSVWVVVWRVKKKMGIPDAGEDMRCDKDVSLGRKKEGNRLRDTKEVGQQGVEDEGTKKRDKE